MKLHFQSWRLKKSGETIQNNNTEQIFKLFKPKSNLKNMISRLSITSNKRHNLAEPKSHSNNETRLEKPTQQPKLLGTESSGHQRKIRYNEINAMMDRNPDKIHETRHKFVLPKMEERISVERNPSHKISIPLWQQHLQS